MSLKKKHIQKLVYALLVSFTLTDTLNSQNLKFKRLSIDEGLSTVSVNSIFQDSQNFIWIGTQDGLNRYDGYHVKTYKTDQYSPSAISSNNINCFYEDKNHNLYIGTDDGGLSVLNKRTEKFVNYRNTSEKRSISNNSVRYIVPLNANELLLATENDINVFNTATAQFELIACSDSVQPTNLKYIYKDSKNRVFIASLGNGLYEYDARLKKIISHPIPKTITGKNKGSVQSEKYNMRCITEVNGKIWCGSDEGILIFDPGTNTFTDVINFGLESKYNNRIVSFTAIQDSSYVWIGTWGGLVKYNITNGTYAISTNDQSNPGSLSDNKISYLLTDNQNNLWVATQDKGINIYFISSNKFPLWDFHSGLANDFIYSVLQTVDNTIWVGTADGFYKKGAKDKSFTDVTAIIKKHDARAVLSLMEDTQGRIWIGTFGQGIIIYDPKNNSSKMVLGDAQLGGTVLKILQTKSEAVWAGTFGDGLYAINPNTLTVKRFTTNQGLPSDKINTIFEDPKDNTLWVGTLGGGLCVLDFITSIDKPIIKIYNHQDEKNSISSNNINHIYKDNAGTYWISTNYGLNKFDKAKKQFLVYTEKDGLLNSYIYAVIPDAEGNFWLPSNFGLTKFNPNIPNENGSAFRNYNTKDGIQGREFNLGASYLCKDGTILVGGISGINYFNPKDIKESKITPNTFIYSFSRQGKEIKTDSSILFIKEIKLEHKENYFTFEVVAVDYQSSGKNKFMYKLEGYDNDWSSPSDVRFVSYTELPGGDYTFKVKATNSDGVWSEKPFELKINVIPPWWRTTWFYIIGTILVFGLVIGFTSYRTNAVKKENKILENKVAERTKELAEKNKDITSSIEYAKRIQEAILPARDLIFSKLKNAFILYRPKDIVSGDFYWFGEKDNYKIIASVDCTGHGVPGAFMSMIGHNLLNQIVSEKGNYDPGVILQLLHKGVQAALKQGQNQVDTNDGMDLSILAINTETREGLWAGAFRNLVIVNEKGELDKVEGNKYPIGGVHFDLDRSYQTHKLSFNKNDMLYMFSDGYADQFGGEKGKKFMVKKFHNNLLSLHHLPVDEQQKQLEQLFDGWKGNYEQVDDVLVIGIKL
jgi:ligand-binding sensor domain-containing protein/serine phosphatase RsbU (regulator of sigma subunit)